MKTKEIIEITRQIAGPFRVTKGESFRLRDVGKDGAIKHVMSGVNPQGCQVYSFKSPSSEGMITWRRTKR
jgi:polyphosphate kinase 2 PPK2